MTDYKHLRSDQLALHAPNDAMLASDEDMVPFLRNQVPSSSRVP